MKSELNNQYFDDLSFVEDLSDIEASQHIGGASFIETAASELGRQSTQISQNILRLSGEIGNTNDPTALANLNGQLAAESQRLSLLQNAYSTTIKSIGEANSSIARKQ